MAVIFNTDRLQGLSGVTVNGVYARIQSVTVKKYDTNRPGGTDGDGNPILIDAVHWRCLYDVVLHANASARNASGEYPEWGNRLRSPQIDHFTCTYDPTSNSNPYDQAYADLKAKLTAGNSPIATSIADA